MDNVLVDFITGVNEMERLYPGTMEAYEGEFDKIPGVFRLMLPMPGAVEAFLELSKHYDVYIASTAPWHNATAWSDKLTWVKHYLGDEAYKRVTLTHHKNLLIGDYLIDDRTANGAGEFQGEHIHFGTDKFPDWESVLAYLLPVK